MHTYSQIFPNIVIAGAPKCATTSLFEWLSAHPAVLGSKVKETYFLMDKTYPLFNKNNNFYLNGLNGYKHFFPNRQAGHMLLEATPDYLYQMTALEVISKIPNKPILLFVLRKPSERVYSLYNFAKNNVSVLDNSISFAEYVQSIQNKSYSQCFKNDEILKNGIRHSQYIDYLVHWKDKIGSSGMHIFLYEDLKSDPKKFMKKLAKILEIDIHFYDSYVFARHNQSYHVRSQGMHRIKKSLSCILPKGDWRNPLKRFYYQINSKSLLLSTRTEDDIIALRILDKYFEKYNECLSKEFKLDLNVWS